MVTKPHHNISAYESRTDILHFYKNQTHKKSYAINGHLIYGHWAKQKKNYTITQVDPFNFIIYKHIIIL